MTRSRKAAGALEGVTAAATLRRSADRAYRASILGALEALERDGVRNRYALVARAAGVTRQTVREIAYRTRTSQTKNKKED